MKRIKTNVSVPKDVKYKGYYEYKNYEEYFKSFLSEAKYVYNNRVYTKAELSAKQEIQDKINKLPKIVGEFDPYICLAYEGIIKPFYLEDSIGAYKDNITFVVDKDDNYKGCIIMVDSAADYGDQWDWTLFEVALDTYNKGFATLGLKYESCFFETDNNLIYYIDKIAKRIYEKADKNKIKKKLDAEARIDFVDVLFDDINGKYGFFN